MFWIKMFIKRVYCQRSSSQGKQNIYSLWQTINHTYQSKQKHEWTLRKPKSLPLTFFVKCCYCLLKSKQTKGTKAVKKKLDLNQHLLLQGYCKNDVGNQRAFITCYLFPFFCFCFFKRNKTVFLHNTIW